MVNFLFKCQPACRLTFHYTDDINISHVGVLEAELNLYVNQMYTIVTSLYLNMAMNNSMDALFAYLSPMLFTIHQCVPVESTVFFSSEL